MSGHALLSASSAHRWINCPPSARLSLQFPDTTSVYAAEGSLAHAIGELKLRKQFIEPMGQRKFNTALKKLQDNELYQPEMLACTDTYVDFINQIAMSYPTKPYVAVEQRLDYSHIVPEGFGTGDCLVIGGNDLYIIDYKHGKTEVLAENNPQMRLYALGALQRYEMLYDIKTVSMTIVQPRLDNICTDEMPVTELLAWGESIKPIAAQAFAGEGDFCAGDWCRFCRARAQCRHRAEHYAALEAFGKQNPALLDNGELGEILATARGFKNWLTDVEDYTLAQLLAGDDIPGWKAVEGRSVRTFADIDKVFKALTDAGIAEELLWTRKPVGITDAEKIAGKPKMTELAEQGLIIKPPGKPTLAQTTDNRPAISNRITAAEAFKNEEDHNHDK